MLTTRQLMRYLRNHHHIAMRSSQAQSLRNLGYYHGYKGYRFIREAKQRITFKSFDEIIAINTFDMRLKSLLYPHVMFIETALKSYVIEAILNDAHSENLNIIFDRSVTHYKTFQQGSKDYKDAFLKRMALWSTINATLRKNYKNNNKIVNHFYGHDRDIPIWAVFESITLGTFGMLFDCCNLQIKRYTSKLLHLPSNLDPNGDTAGNIILTLKNLRNSIAHNNVIYDTRFQTKPVSQKLIRLLKSETGLKDINFSYIDAYFILIIYILRKMKISKTECRQLIAGYDQAKETLRKQIPNSTWNQVLGSNTRNNMNALKQFINTSK